MQCAEDFREPRNKSQPKIHIDKPILARKKPRTGHKRKATKDENIPAQTVNRQWAGASVQAKEAFQKRAESETTGTSSAEQEVPTQTPAPQDLKYL